MYVGLTYLSYANGHYYIEILTNKKVFPVLCQNLRGNGPNVSNRGRLCDGEIPILRINLPAEYVPLLGWVKNSSCCSRK